MEVLKDINGGADIDTKNLVSTVVRRKTDPPWYPQTTKRESPASLVRGNLRYCRTKRDMALTVTNGMCETKTGRTVLDGGMRQLTVRL